MRNEFPPVATCVILLAIAQDTEKYTLQKIHSDQGHISKITGNIQGQTRYPKELVKNLCDKDFVEFSGELSGAICLIARVLLGSALNFFRNFFGAVHAGFWLCGSFLALDSLKYF